VTVRISDILGAPVVDEAGRALGRVHDVRLVQVAPFGARRALQVTGVVVGKGSLGVRLGYGSQDQTGPWLLRLVFGTLGRHSRYIPWHALRFDDGSIVVTTSVELLTHPRHADGDAVEVTG
jgi:hypothetical protein